MDSNNTPNAFCSTPSPSPSVSTMVSNNLLTHPNVPPATKQHAASFPTNPPASTTNSTDDSREKEPAVQSVMEFLKKRGLGNAILELQHHLDHDKNNPTTSNSATEDTNLYGPNAKRSKTEGAPSTIASASIPNSSEGAATMNATTATEPKKALLTNTDQELARYDAKKQNEKTALTLTTGGGLGYDMDAKSEIVSWGSSLVRGKDGSTTVSIQKRKDGGGNETGVDGEAETVQQENEQDEARKLVKSFTLLQTWVLSLPNEDLGLDGSWGSTNEKQEEKEESNPMTLEEKEETLDESTTTYNNDGNINTSSLLSKIPQSPSSQLFPASIKPELLETCFCLLVHTYCELLECGLESTAYRLLSTYRPIHEPRHPSEFIDLTRMRTTAQLVQLGSWIEAANNIATEVKKCRIKLEKLKKHASGGSNTGASTSTGGTHQIGVAALEEVNELKRLLAMWKERVSNVNSKLDAFPFLKKAKSSRRQLMLSSVTFVVLARFLKSQEDLIYMSSMLQHKCHLMVEQRDPMPFVPACVAQDLKGGSVRWAAPINPMARAMEAGVEEMDSNVAKKTGEKLPYPKYYLEKEYETEVEYLTEKKKVEFNRSLLINGFRRLSALEKKQEYDVYKYSAKDLNSNDSTAAAVNPFEPSILHSTLCSSSSSTKPSYSNAAGGVAALEESGVDIVCSKFCPPDGRRVAAGCSDSAIRVFNLQSWTSNSGKSTVDNGLTATAPSESTITMIGHKNGLPVFDLDWNRDGRTLVSAGGDGTVRLWDTMAVGTYGKLKKVLSRSTPIQKGAGPESFVPGLHAESMVEQNGAALASYHGHALASPVWSVAMAPSGYYFASAAGDSTARLWCMDSPTPVRIFTGHLSENVNCVSWHPNCNYIITGADDKTARLWDIQSGNCVRLLAGSGYGINQVQVSPSGQFAAGADYNGVVHVWDLGNGRKIHELRPEGNDADNTQRPAIHSMNYSPCGSAIATGSDDSSIRVWDVRGLAKKGFDRSSTYVGNNPFNGIQMKKQYIQTKPTSLFHTSHTMLLDLKYTKRNLLLSVGKFSSKRSSSI